MRIAVLQARWTHDVFDTLDWQFGESGLLGRARRILSLGVHGSRVSSNTRSYSIEPGLLLVGERVKEFRKWRPHRVHGIEAGDQPI
jgi:hypothetical protein